jgi:hypothetical protein
VRGIDLHLGPVLGPLRDTPYDACKHIGESGNTPEVLARLAAEMTHVVHPHGSLMSGRFVDYQVGRISGRVQPVRRSVGDTAS